jgi:MFS family permease
MLTSYGWYVFFKLILGISQSGFIACIIVYLVSFYTKEESATRFSYVFVGSSVAEALFELISNSASRADEQMDLSGWQWVFVVEGLVMIFLGIFTW